MGNEDRSDTPAGPGAEPRPHDRLVERMLGAWRLDAHALTGYSAVDALYRNLLPLDFSHDVAEGREGSLSVLRVPPCGWSDLGTPERVARALRRPGSLGAEHAAQSAPLSLAERLREREAAAAANL